MAEASMKVGTPESGSLGLLRAVALAAAVAGAVGSVGLTLYAGRRNESRLLMAIFVVWVVSPFVGLAWCHLASRRWPVAARGALYWVMVGVAVVSLGVYGDVAVWHPRVKQAFVFLVVPPGSLVVSGVVVGVAARVFGRRRGGRRG